MEKDNEIENTNKRKKTEINSSIKIFIQSYIQKNQAYLYNL